jgi:hypothetical protein
MPRWGWVIWEQGCDRPGPFAKMNPFPYQPWGRGQQAQGTGRKANGGGKATYNKDRPSLTLDH